MRSPPLGRGLIALLVLLPLTAAPGAAGKDEVFRRGAVGTRAYRLFVPSRPPRGLVVALHGCWQTAEDFAAGTRLNEGAERRTLLVVYPIQSARDNPNRCWNWFLTEHQSRARGELAEIVSVVDALRRQHSVPADRVAAVGFSAGALPGSWYTRRRSG